MLVSLNIQIWAVILSGHQKESVKVHEFIEYIDYKVNLRLKVLLNKSFPLFKNIIS